MLAAAAAALALQAVPAGLAHAQIGNQSKSPIDITADQAEVVQSKCQAIWRGAAEALQDQSRLRADTITVSSQHKTGAAAKAQDPNGQGSCGPTDRIEADGHVYYVTPEREARGDHAVYTQSNDQIVMTGDVIVVQGKSVIHGDRLVIQTATHQAQMESTAHGRGVPNRVRAVLFQAPGANAPAPAAH